MVGMTNFFDGALSVVGIRIFYRDELRAVRRASTASKRSAPREGGGGFDREFKRNWLDIAASYEMLATNADENERKSGFSRTPRRHLYGRLFG